MLPFFHYRAVSVLVVSVGCLLTASDAMHTRRDALTVDVDQLLTTRRQVHIHGVGAHDDARIIALDEDAEGKRMLSPRRSESVSVLGEMCLDEMCVNKDVFMAKRGVQRLAVASDRSGLNQSYKADRSLKAGCSHKMHSDERMFLISSAMPFHGSTALEGVLMSSKKVATLCSMGHWQCESEWEHYEDCSISASKPAEMIHKYSKYWKPDRPIFMAKSMWKDCGLKALSDRVPKSPMPGRLSSAGVHQIRMMYILMWRPLCLNGISSKAKHFFTDKEEVHFLVKHEQIHRTLSNMGEPVLVVNFGDLLWRPDWTGQRMSKFMPCARGFNMDFVAQEGVDTVKNNRWKLDGSVREFGNAIDPEECCEYSVAKGKCNHQGFDSLKEADKHSGLGATDYLRKFSG